MKVIIQSLAERAFFFHRQDKISRGRRYTSDKINPGECVLIAHEKNKKKLYFYVYTLMPGLS